MSYWNDKAEIIKHMEWIIAKNCSTETYNIGNYRYPVHFNKNGKWYKTSGNSLADVSYQDISSMYYEFGAHTLNIGDALIEIMEYLEQRNSSAMEDLIMYPEDED